MTVTHADAERGFRDLLRDAGLPAPDEVAHFRGAVVFYFHASRALILVDLEEFDPQDPEPVDPEAFADLLGGDLLLDPYAFRETG